MAWLQSSFTSHQLLGDSSSNHKKGFKSGACNNGSDPDKSDTPLLHDSPHSPEVENTSSGWLRSSSGDKKQNSTNNTSKSSFLPHGLFDKTLGNSKNKTQPNQNASSASSFGKKPSENMKLLSGDDKKKNPLFEDDDDEDDKEEDSDDEWYIPNLIGIRKAGDFGGYQKVRPSTE